MYKVGDQEFALFTTACHYAKSVGLDVMLDGIRKWTPAPSPKKPRERHVLINRDGTQTEIGRVRQ